MYQPPREADVKMARCGCRQRRRRREQPPAGQEAER